MGVRTGVPATTKNTRSRLLSSLCAIWVICLSACTGGFETEPLVEFSTELRVDGAKPQSFIRQLRAGTYLVEIRERDIDLRIQIDADDQHTELADAYLRHGLHRAIVSLAQPAMVRVTLASVDQRNWRGAAAVRVLRWPQPASDAPPDQRLLGYLALGKANGLIARRDSASWRAAIAPMRQAAAHFAAANDMQALAESRISAQRGRAQPAVRVRRWSQDRRVGRSAFRAADDAIGEARAAVMRALNEFSLASGMGPDIPRAEQRTLLDNAVLRVAARAGIFRSERTAHRCDRRAPCKLHSRAGARRIRAGCARLSRNSRARTGAWRQAFRSARDPEPGVHRRRARETSRSPWRCSNEVLPLIERDRNPDLYATLISNLGSALIALGEFDRALMLHTEALELFSARGDESQTARELAALASIQFRSGNVERALITIESALPLYERAQRPGRSTCRRCASRATRRPSSASTTPRSNTCAAPNTRTGTASPSTARACSSRASCARSATCAAPSGCCRRCC